MSDGGNVNASLAAWLEAGSSAAVAVIAIGGVLGTVWKFMISPLKASIKTSYARADAAHVRINETNMRFDKMEVQIAQRIDAVDVKVDQVSEEHHGEHIANLGRLAGIELKLAGLPTKADLEEMRREQREDARQFMARIDDLFRMRNQ